MMRHKSNNNIKVKSLTMIKMLKYRWLKVKKLLQLLQAQNQQLKNY